MYLFIKFTHCNDVNVVSVLAHHDAGRAKVLLQVLVILMHKQKLPLMMLQKFVQIHEC